MQHLAELLTALAIAHTIHAFGETTNVRTKLQRLTDAVKGKKLAPYPININTRPKAYSLGFGLPILLTLIAYLVLTLLAPNITMLLWISIGFILLIEVYNAVALDKYHIAIQPLINKFEKK